MIRRLMTPCMLRRCFVLAFLILPHPLISKAQISLLPDEVERVDVIAIERDGRDYYAFDALTGRRSTIRLELGEDVRFERSRGRIGLVLTDRRALGVASGFGWQELRYQLQEKAPELGLIEDRLAMVVTARRVLGFNGHGSWVEERFSPREFVRALRVGSAVGIVATNRRALGLAVGLGNFLSTDLQIQEELESITTQDTLATLRTDRRILVFSGPNATWSEQKRLIK